MRRARVLTPLFAALLLLAATLGAQQHPSLQRGFKPEEHYQLGGLDNVNLMNGNLLISIPVGHRYPVGGNLSYGLSLVYNSKAWDFQEVYYQGNAYGQALPDRLSNAGMGWSLSLGRLLDPNDPLNDYGPGQWVFIGPDGAEHVFYQGLQSVGPVGVDPCTSACYTRDGSYIRLRTLSSSQRVVEHPDGTRLFFQRTALPNSRTEWRLVEIRDRFEDGLSDVSISYSADGNLWTITDKHGRTQRVFFGSDPTGRYERLLQSIELTSFGSGPPAVYSFSYLPPQPVAVPCGSTLPFWNSVTVPLLSGVSLPDQTSYGMQYYTSASSTCHAKALLSDLVLPTRGKLHYTYQTHTLPIKACSIRAWLSQTAGVATRQLLTAAGGDAGTWTYSSVLSQPRPSTPYLCDDGMTQFSPPSEEIQVTVVTPLKDKNVHYFSVFPGTEFPYASAFDERDYGLPFSKLPPADGTGTRFLSTQVYDCDPTGANCVLVRSRYVRYERDADSRCDVSSGPGPDCLNTNRRLASERVVFHDDGGRYADTNHSDFDNFGHYRTVATDANFPSSGNQRTTFTNYNPGNVLPGSAWVLNTYKEQTVTEGGASAKVQLCFDPATGFLRRTRTYSTGTNPSANDVLVVSTPDGAGNTVQEEWFGGDLASQALSLSTDLCNLGLPAANAYRLDHTYQYGTLASSQYKNASGAAPGSLAFKQVDQDVDFATGLPATSRDSAGIATTLSYDAMGRLLSEKPQTAGAAWTEYIYTNASAGNRARVEIRQCSPANQTACTPLSQSQTEFDDFGRLAKERRLMANGLWSKQVTAYNLAGNRASVSELQPDSTPDGSLARTTYSGYDPFGRPGMVTPPDGANHAVTFAYYGDRVKTRTAKIGTGTPDANGNIPETSVTRTFVYDRQGRLWRTNELSGPGGTSVSTEYGYDVGGRLSSAKTFAPEGTQTRFFTYDNRGFLKTENHPEKNGVAVRYSGYDPMGNAGRVEDVAGGPNDLSMSYDRAGRLVQMWETGGRTLKTFTYASANGAGNFKNGKLEQAKRYNYVAIGTTPFTVELTQTYTYGGVAGRVSKRDTALVTNGTPGESFTQSFAWDALGNPASAGSSRCTHAGCTGAAATERTFSFTYTNGFLTAVPGYASSISYHANGLVHQVQHVNGVIDTQAVDATNWLARPLSIATTGANANWNTGTYKYDGSGNVTRIGTDWFHYDKAGRLLRGVVHEGQTGGGTEKQQAYTFDTFGNITETATTAAGTTQTRATPTTWSTNRLAGTATYDAAGNLTGWNGATYQYNPLNQMWRMENGGEGWLYLYTADDERFWSFKLNASFSRWTLRDLSGKVIREYVTDAAGWSVAADYVHRDGMLLAAETPSGRRHFHLDHLGSPRLITNASAQKVAYHVYYPFGEEATAFNQDAERMKFTGHERDLASLAGPGDDLDYMHARFHSPLTGRFLSVDPLTGDPSEPQSWNRYAYVRGNPLKYTDPLGLEIECGQAQDAGRGGYNAVFCTDSITVNDADCDNVCQVARELQRMQLPQFGELMTNIFYLEMSVLLPLGFGEVAVAGGLGLSGTAAAGRVGSTGLELAAAERGGTYVYRSLNAEGQVQYVGITNNFKRRAVEHLRVNGFDIERVATGLSRSAARGVEQALIEIHGLPQTGGTLLNKINSIARTNPAHSQLVPRGYEILKMIGSSLP